MVINSGYAPPHRLMPHRCVYKAIKEKRVLIDAIPWMRTSKVNETEPCELDTVQVQFPES